MSVTVSNPMINLKKQFIKFGFYFSFYILLTAIPFNVLNSISFLDKFLMKFFPPEIITSIPLSLIRKNLIIAFVAILLLNISTILLKKVDYFDIFTRNTYQDANIKIKLVFKEVFKFCFSFLLIYSYLRDLSIDDTGIYFWLKLLIFPIFLLWYIVNTIVEYKTKKSIWNNLLKIK